MTILLNQIMAYEDGEMTDEEVVDFFQDLVNTGMAWKLQGHYGRVAMELLREGVIHAPISE